MVIEMKIKDVVKLLTIIFFIASYYGVSLADKGVFNAKISPNEIFVNNPTIVTIAAEIGSENLYISSVRAYKTTTDGKPIALLGQMYDDGTHGDAKEADTIFTMQYTVNESEKSNSYVMVTAAYSGDRNRFLSSILKISAYPELPNGVSEEVVTITDEIKRQFYSNISIIGVEAALRAALDQALNDSRIESATLRGFSLSIITRNGIRGWIELTDPSTPSDGAGESIPSSVPEDYKGPGNDKVLIFAPGYDEADRQNQIADSAINIFNNAAYMSFTPTPLSITKNASASLDSIKTWGNYGAVVIHTHGGNLTDPKSKTDKVVLLSGTKVSPENDSKYSFDLQAEPARLGVYNGKYYIYPEYITAHSNNMNNTFFYLGACHSLENTTMWNALKAKGAKVALGWSDTVDRNFNTEKFNELTGSMLPSNSSEELHSATEAFDNIDDKVDGWCPFGICFGGDGATLTLKTASSDWNNFVFYEGGIVNGDFETGDWTGWIHGGDYNYRIIAGARKHTGSYSSALGRWDTSYHGYDPTSEPLGYEWFYQDFVVPDNITYLKFYWWMETYDTAAWDWFDAYIKDTNGNNLITILSNAGKPGTNYGPYWTTSDWQEVKVDISAYRGQKIRIYFDQRLDGYGDQQRVYVDDVSLE